MDGDKPAGLIVAAVTVATFVALPALIVPAFYLIANAYAVVTGTDFSSDTMNVSVFLTLLVLTVAIFVVAMAIGVGLVGRSLSPKRRRDD
jgi:type II secretory pathway component PulF